MMALLGEYRFDKFCDQIYNWYQAVERSSENPVVQGHLAEHICLCHISVHGLQVVNPILDRMDRVSFRYTPDWDNLLLTDKTRCLYVPTTFNFNYGVDGVILLLDHSTKEAHLYPIQMTLSLRHKASDSDFYSMRGLSWIRSIEEAGFVVNMTFVWIDKEQPSNELYSALTKHFRSRSLFARPAYVSTHIGIGQVDKQLAESLESACKLLFDLASCLIRLHFTQLRWRAEVMERRKGSPLHVYTCYIIISINSVCFVIHIVLVYTKCRRLTRVSKAL